MGAASLLDGIGVTAKARSHCSTGSRLYKDNAAQAEMLHEQRRIFLPGSGFGLDPRQDF
jgi:hypothetical protein